MSENEPTEPVREGDERGPWFDAAERYGFFVPIGLVSSVARSVPGSVDELADRGRAEVVHLLERVEMKVRTARVIGQFAAPRVRRAITDRVDQQRAARRAAARAQSPDAPDAPDGDVEGAAAPTTAPTTTAPTTTAPTTDGAVTAVPAEPTAASPGDRTADANPSGELPIDGYDQLGASQIVARLEGLGPAELETVRRYELAGRQRRTILTKIQQLTSDR